MSCIGERSISIPRSTSTFTNLHLPTRNSVLFCGVLYIYRCSLFTALPQSDAFVAAAGTSRAPAPPPARACTRGWTGSQATLPPSHRGCAHISTRHDVVISNHHGEDCMLPLFLWTLTVHFGSKLSISCAACRHCL